jgi:Tol biopolymer transport system component
MSTRLRSHRSTLALVVVLSSLAEATSLIACQSDDSGSGGTRDAAVADVAVDVTLRDAGPSQDAPSDSASDSPSDSSADSASDGGTSWLPACGSAVRVTNGSITPSGYSVAVSADGRYVAFTTLSSYLATDTNDVTDVYVRDLATGSIELVSVSSAGVTGNRGSGVFSLSSNGRYVLFESSADNLVAGDTNQVGDVFVRDRVAGTTERVNLRSDGGESSAAGSSVGIADDGHLVLFESTDTAIVPGSGTSTGGFLRDRTAGTSSVMSFDAGTKVTAAALSRSGQVVVFVEAPIRGRLHVFDLGLQVGGALVADDAGLTGSNDVPRVSDNGRFVAFVHDLASIYRVDRTSNQVALAAALADAGARPQLRALSADGNTIAIETGQPYDYARDINIDNDVYTFDFAKGTVNLASRGLNGKASGAGTGGAREVAITADGKYVVLTSFAPLVADDTNGQVDVYLVPTGCP